MPTESIAWIGVTLKDCRKNARARGIAFDLTREDVEHLVRRAENACEVTGIPFERDRPHGAPLGYRRPWVQSIDRIDSTQGYTRENCRLVCCAVNYAMNQWGESVLLRIIEVGRMAKREIVTGGQVPREVPESDVPRILGLDSSALRVYRRAGDGPPYASVQKGKQTHHYYNLNEVVTWARGKAVRMLSPELKVWAAERGSHAADL